MHSVPRRTPPEFAWLLPAGTLFLMGGILLGRHPEAWWIAALALACSLCAALLSRRWMRFAAAVLACASLGAISGWLCRHPALPQEGTYAVQAVVADEIEVTPDGHVQTLLTGVRLNGACAPDAYWTFYLNEGKLCPAGCCQAHRWRSAHGCTTLPDRPIQAVSTSGNICCSGV